MDLSEKTITVDGGRRMCYPKDSFEAYLRKSNKILDNHRIIIKYGYVSKDTPVMTDRERIAEVQARVRESLLHQNQLSEIRSIITNAENKIKELIEVESKTQTSDIERIQLESIKIAEDMFVLLADEIYAIAINSYTLYLAAYNEVLNVTSDGTELTKEDIDKICPWLAPWIEKEKDRILDEISIAFIGLISGEYTEKFFSLAFLGALALALSFVFTGCSERTEDSIRSSIDTSSMEALKDSLLANGIEEYEIISIIDENTCDTCRDMHGVSYAVIDFDIGTTAPPFHPNCRCTITAYVVDDWIGEEENDIDLLVTAEQLSYIGFANITDEMVEDLNRVLVKYGITTKEQIAHFLAQCLVESWNGRSLTEINWTNYPNSSQEEDRIHFNTMYGNRNDLGNLGVNTNDGYNYRGAGYIQLTGRYNYQQFADYIGDPNVMQGAEYVAANYAWEVAAWFWTEFKDINSQITPDTTVREVTRTVQGGSGELEEREEAFLRAMDIL
ncbi:MAG: minor capsid protein [Oscillospiraceae bacterium]|nr:minor capsid protein [Oscillospiraceae bacterium]